MTQKLINKKRDPMAEARKSKKFQQYSKDVMSKLRLAVEVYNSRNTLELSQQALAKEINSTQKVISKVENGDMNLGIELLSRFVEKLNFNSDTLARIFNCGQTYVFITIGTPKSETKNETISMTSNENLSSKIGTTITGGDTTSFPPRTSVVSSSDTIKYLNK